MQRFHIEVLLAVVIGWCALAIPVLSTDHTHYDAAFLPVMHDVVERDPASVAGTSPSRRSMPGNLRGSADLGTGACKRGQPSGLVLNRHVHGSRSQSVSDRVDNLCLLCVAFDGRSHSWPCDRQKNLVERRKSGLVANKGLMEIFRPARKARGLSCSAFAVSCVVGERQR